MSGLSQDDPDYYRAKEAFTTALNESMPGRAPVTIEMVNGKLMADDGNYQNLLPAEVKHAAAPPADTAPKREAPATCSGQVQETVVPTVTDHRSPVQKAAAEKFWKDHHLDQSFDNNPDGGKMVMILPGDNIWNFAAKETEERQGHVMSVTDRGDMRNVLQLTKNTAADNKIEIDKNGKAMIHPNDWLHIPAQR